MYTLSYIHHNIPLDIYPIANKVIYRKNLAFWSMCNNTLDKLVDIDNYFSPIYFANNNVYIIDEDKLKIFSIDFQNTKITSISSQIPLRFGGIVEDKLFLVHDRSHEQFIVKIDEEGYEYWKKDVFSTTNCYVHNNAVITNCNNNLIAFSPNNGNELWNIDFRKLLNVSKEDVSGLIRQLFIFGDCLFVYAAGDDFREVSATFCIDIPTGEVFRTIDYFGGYMFPGNNKLYNNYEQTINYLDVNTFELSSITIKSELFKKYGWDIEAGTSVVKDGLMYCSASIGVELNSYLIVIDLSTYEVVWYTELLVNPKKKSSRRNRLGVYQIRVNDQILCVSCSGSYLCVFEKILS